MCIALPLAMVALAGYSAYSASQNQPSRPGVVSAQATEVSGKELQPGGRKKKRKYFGEAQRERDLGPLSLAKGGVLGPSQRDSESMFG